MLKLSCKNSCAKFKGKINESLPVANTKKLTYEFLYDNFIKKISKFFFLKLSCKNSCAKFHEFSREIVRFFPQK